MIAPDGSCSMSNISESEFAAWRKASMDRLAERQSCVRYQNLDAWFESANPDAELIIAFRGCDLPLGIFEEWAGLVTLPSTTTMGHIGLNTLYGVALDGAAPVVVEEGVAPLAPELQEALLALLSSHAVAEFTPVPDRCYDGAPTKMRLRYAGEETRTDANAADFGTEPALLLAKLLWRIAGSVPLTETQRYTPPPERDESPICRP
jgi:hypothetical protein